MPLDTCVKFESFSQAADTIEHALFDCGAGQLGTNVGVVLLSLVSLAIGTLRL
jgi:hypothetical protein